MRVDSIDAIRGVAILGILFMNISFHQNMYIGYVHFDPVLPSDWLIQLFNSVFVDGRFRSLFCLLFGAGLAIQYEHCQKRGLDFRDFSRARLTWLFVFGLAHAVFVFGGDILMYYSICGLILYSKLNQCDEVIRKQSLVYMLIGSVLMLTLGAVLAALTTPEDILIRNSDAFNEAVQYWHSGYLAQMGIQVGIALVILIASPFSMLWQSVGLMLLGVWLYRTGFFVNGFSSRTFRMLLSLSVVMTVIAVFPQFGIEHIDPETLSMFSSISAIPVSLVYAHLLVRIKNKQSGWYQALVNCGKTAFSLYLLQSLCMALLFRVIAPEWFPRFAYDSTMAQLLMICIVFTACQLVLGKLMVTHLKHGPFEALWRRVYLRSYRIKQQNKSLPNEVSE